MSDDFRGASFALSKNHDSLDKFIRNLVYF